MSTFTSVDESRLREVIARCHSRLVYIAPGATKGVAHAIGALFDMAPTPAITLIIDTDPEVYRLGYGTQEGLEALQGLVERHHVAIRYQPGLRIGVLIVDEQMLVYAPTPLLIEAGSSREDQPNAIVIGSDPLPSVLAACAAEGEAHAVVPSQAQIGRTPVTPTLLEESLADLARVPPKKFDVARVERVFSSKLQYVELEVTGYRLSAKKVHIPNDLLIGEDATLEARLRNTFTLLEGKEAVKVDIELVDPETLEPLPADHPGPRKVLYSEKQLEMDRKKIYEDFLTNVPGYGWLIRRWDRDAFDHRIDWFKQRVAAFQAGVEAKLRQAIEKSIEDLADTLLPKLREQFPRRLGKQLMSAEPTDPMYLDVLRRELEGAFGLEDGFFSPQIRVQFKDLTYETISDSIFREALKDAYGCNGAAAEMFEEFDAARAESVPEPRAFGQ